MNSLHIDQLNLSFGDKKVLKNLSLSLSQGHTHGLVGLNGSGKTTLLNVVFGFLKAQSGQVLWQNQAISKDDIALLETHNYFYHHVTGNEYLSLFRKERSNFDLREWNERFQLPLDDLIDGYSTGMKKKLALLGIMHLDRPVIILDEPYNGLDLEAVFWLEKIVRTFQAEGRTIIITSHILETLLSVCDQIHWLKDGTIEKTFTKEQFNTIDQEIFRELRD
jgi:ABC-2 type transport system ATP-binding protein